MGMTVKTLLLGLVGGLSLSAAAYAQGEPRTAQVNQGTVGVISGGVNGTYIRIAADLSAVLDTGDLRVLSMLGKGSLQNVTDLLYLKGVDVAIVQSDVLEYLRRRQTFGAIDQRIHYVTKLYNEEFHLLAGPDIRQLADLAGRKVNYDVAGSGTAITASIVFETLKIPVEPTNYDQAAALEKLKSGEIQALAYVAGKPAQLFSALAADSRLHFLPLDHAPALLETYLPSRLSHEDYPNLIAAGGSVDTIAVGAVMAVYNWQGRGHSARYQRVARFVDRFFERFAEFQQPARHPKWREVSLSAVVPGWTRFAVAEAWLKKTGGR